jgi:uncharacterized protein (TIGR03083 family)
VADLGVHLGIIHRWAAEMVQSGATERLGGREKRFAIDPDDASLVDWFLTGARELVAVLAACPLDRPVWSWMPDTTAAFWHRRQAHETAVHRWDAQAAAGWAQPIEASLAADGVDEVLTVFAAGRTRAHSTRAGQGESFHFHCTDTAGEWTVLFEGPGIDVRAEHAKADVAVRGPAAGLLLFLWGRRPAEGLDVVGDSALLGRWSARDFRGGRRILESRPGNTPTK